jgi:hypothetical protein
MEHATRQEGKRQLRQDYRINRMLFCSSFPRSSVGTEDRDAPASLHPFICRGVRPGVRTLEREDLALPRRSVGAMGEPSPTVTLRYFRAKVHGEACSEVSKGIEP